MMARVLAAAALLLSVATVTASRPVRAEEGRRLQQSLEWLDLDGVGCNGPTLSTKRVTSRELCKSECEAEDSCSAYSFNDAKGRCFLKRGRCLVRDKNAGNDSGELPGRVTEGRPQVYFMHLKFRSCEDDNLGEGQKVDGLEACEALCAADERCLAYSLNVDRMRCYLKSEPCKQQADNDSNLSGVRLGTVETPVLFERLSATGCNDETLATVHRASRKACEISCAATADCAAYSFNKDNRKCFLKPTACLEPEDQDRNESGVVLSRDPLVATESAGDPTPTPTPTSEDEDGEYEADYDGDYDYDEN